MRYDEILSKLISFDTSNEKGCKECYDYIKSLLKNNGFIVESIHKKNGNPGILWATLPSSLNKNATGGVLFSGHLDVVPCSDSGWDTPPFQSVQKDGKIFARGSCDMKGFVSCVLANVLDLKTQKTKEPIHLCFSFDEESEMLAIKSSAPLLKKYAPEWCWVGEPSSMEMIASHRGCVTGMIEVKGVSAHGSTPHKGISAIEASLDIIECIRNIAKEKKQNPFPNSPFECPYTVFNFGQINGGNAPNTVPDFCQFSYQYRPHPGENISEINKRIDDFILVLNEKFRNVPGAGVSSHRRFIDDDLNCENTKAISFLSQLLGSRKIKNENYVTEAGFIQKKGIPTVVCGPGSIEQAHKNNEFVPVAELKKCNAMVLTLCQFLCNNDKNLTLQQFVSKKTNNFFER